MYYYPPNTDQHLIETFGEIEMTDSNNAYMIFDMQFGSTGKGLLAGYLAKKRKPDVVVTAWGPNAGHTYIDANGRKFVHRMLANGVVSPGLKYILMGPGSVIDLKQLWSEIESCKDLLTGVTIIIHPKAIILQDCHVECEKTMVKIGSTMKGTGAAYIDRILRNPDNHPCAFANIPEWFESKIAFAGIRLSVNQREYTYVIINSKTLQIEGAQGFSLSMYHGIYPYTTSRDVTPHQVLADCGVPYGIMGVEVYGTLRTLPIRVANREDKDGKQIGWSGPSYTDQVELDWEKDLNMEPELTTVTKLPRRIFSFSMQQYIEALEICQPTKLFLNFCNYMNQEALVELQIEIEKQGVDIEWFGYGPTVNDITEISA